MFLWKKTSTPAVTTLDWLYWNYDPIYDKITEIDVDPTKVDLWEEQRKRVSQPEQLSIYNAFGMSSKELGDDHE